MPGLQQPMTTSLLESPHIPIHSNDEANDAARRLSSGLSRQSSYKRVYAKNDKENESEIKRFCTISADDVSCPLAHLGCEDHIDRKDLDEHYISHIHQKYLTDFCLKSIPQLQVKSTTSSDVQDYEETHSEIFECIDQLSNGVATLHDDSIRMYRDLSQVQNNILQQQNQIEQLKNSIEESAQLFHGTQLNSQIVRTEIDSLKEKFTDLSNTSSHDGTFIWKITDVSQKIKDAIAEKQTSIYSPPFCSSPNGYKMRMRLYFNGDGNGRKTFLSIFFVLMRGEFDAILLWPFSYKVTFCLYDQTDKQNHIIDSFRPDIKSNSFQRPRSNMNIASGLPKFCPLSIIHTDNNPYVRDDCMFIRCIVDFDSLPKSALNYMCHLNAALPKDIQSKKIQEELQRIKVSSSSTQSIQQLTASNLDKVNIIEEKSMCS